MQRCADVCFITDHNHIENSTLACGKLRCLLVTYDVKWIAMLSSTCALTRASQLVRAFWSSLDQWSSSVWEKLSGSPTLIRTGAPPPVVSPIILSESHLSVTSTPWKPRCLPWHQPDRTSPLSSYHQTLYYQIFLLHLDVCVDHVQVDLQIGGCLQTWQKLLKSGDAWGLRNPWPAY